MGESQPFGSLRSAQPRPSENGAFAELEKQLSAHGSDLSKTQQEAPGSKAAEPSPFAQGIQSFPWDQQISFGQNSRQSDRQELATAVGREPAVGRDTPAAPHRSLTPSALQQHLAGIASEIEGPAKEQQPQEQPGKAEAAEQRQGSAEEQGMEANPPIKYVKKVQDNPKLDWGPFTAPKPASTSSMWAQPWSQLGRTDSLKPASGWGHGLQGMATASSRSELQTPVPASQGQPPSASLSAAGQKPGLDDTQWYSQFATLQSASRGNLVEDARSAQATGPAPVPQQTDPFARLQPGLPIKPPTDPFAKLVGHEKQPAEPNTQLLPGAQRPASHASLNSEASRQADSHQGLGAEPMIPSWLQTPDQGSGVWGNPAPAQAPQPAQQAQLQASSSGTGQPGEQLPRSYDVLQSMLGLVCDDLEDLFARHPDCAVSMLIGTVAQNAILGMTFPSIFDRHCGESKGGRKLFGCPAAMASPAACTAQ